MTISAQQRRYVFERAGRCCEYCLVGDGRESIAFHIDHINAIKHGGEDLIDNLCLSCAECNLYKGSAVAAIDPQTGEATKLFHPRQQNWDEHFVYYKRWYARWSHAGRPGDGCGSANERSAAH